MKHLIKVKEISNITDVDYERIILTEDGSIYTQGVNTSNTYNAIDLGLPSGLLWCDRNVGAPNITDSGLYFQWGDTQGWTKEQIENGEKEFNSDWIDYKWFDNINYTFTKYNYKDGLTTLELEDDAAHVYMGSNWRMPTHEEWQELIENVDVTLIYKNGTEAVGIVDESGYIYWQTVDLSGEEVNEHNQFLIQGIRLTGRGDYSNNSIFIPAAGYVSNSNVAYNSIYGHLWSASMYSLDDMTIAYGLNFNTVRAYIPYNISREVGLFVRGVMTK